MSGRLVDGVRAVQVGVSGVAESAAFYASVWNLDAAAVAGGVSYWRGTGQHHHILALRERPRTELLCIDLSSPSAADVDAAYARLRNEGLAASAPGAIDEPGGGYGFAFQDPEGRRFRLVAGDARRADAADRPDRPRKIAHVVLNSADVAGVGDFLGRVLGFTVSDRTRMMTFLRCSADHHSIALAHADAPTLNHIAFEMPDLDSVMRGAGRMRDHGFPIEWGIGRHGPGNNVFAYFVGPGDVVIEYTAEVERVDESYVAGAPEDWTWPPGRIDQWGIAHGPTDRLKKAQRHIRFAAGPDGPRS